MTNSYFINAGNNDEMVMIRERRPAVFVGLILKRILICLENLVSFWNLTN